MKQICSRLYRVISTVLMTALIFSTALWGATATAAEEMHAEVDKPAPDFALLGSDGQEHPLSSYKGKIVVLEWVNYECPFVKKHYHEPQRNMQKLQAYAEEKGIVWLSISSSGEGKQGYMNAADAKRLSAERGASPTVTLLDHTGRVGKLYGARTTPHLFVIDVNGILRYMGAIDDAPSTDPDDIAEAKNYVRQAIDELLAGKEVSDQITESYGCSVKYAL